MEENSTYYVDLIARYLAGEATPEEITGLSLWLKSDTANQKLFEELSGTWNIVEEKAINNKIDIDEEWKKISPLIAGITAKEKEPKIIPIEKGKSLNGLTRFLRIAAAVIVIVVAGYAAYYFLRDGEPQIKTLVAQTTSIEKQLPDGTSVTLNTGSSLSYPEKFNSDKRTVTLKGEAYFNVTHDAEHPFIIAAGDMRVEVLGTSFYVNTNSENGNVEVILTSGKVAVYHKDKPAQRTILEPGEKAEFSQSDNKITKSANDDQNYMAFKTKKLVFYNTPFSEVVACLNKVYNSNIKISGDKLADCSVSSTIDANKVNLDGALKILDATLFIKIKKTSMGIEISGEECK